MFAFQTIAIACLQQCSMIICAHYVVLGSTDLFACEIARVTEELVPARAIAQQYCGEFVLELAGPCTSYFLCMHACARA